MKSTFFLTAATLFFTAANAQVTDSTQNNTGNTGTNTGNTMGTTGTMGSTDTTRKLNAYGSYSTRDSIAAKYKLLPMPGKLSLEKTFPILGTYNLVVGQGQAATGAASTTTTGTSATTDATTTTGTTTTGTTTDAGTGVATTAAGPAITISIDSASRGIVWVDGLEQGRLKAFLKKSPATYRIIAQKTGNGVSIPEGTMHLDSATNTLHIAMGAPYNDADPTGIFALSTGVTAEDNTAEVKVKTKNTKTKSKITFITATKVDTTQMQQDGMQQGAATDATQQGGMQQQQNQQQ